MLELKHMFKWIGGIILGISAFFMLISMFNSVELGEKAVYQNNFTGKKEVYYGPDFVIRPPLISNLTIYKKDTTISFAPREDGDGFFTSNNGPIPVSFADTYKAKIRLNARMVLPDSDEQMLALHEAFRSQENLVASLYTKTLQDVVVNTATQFTAEEVFQGGLNGLKSAIEDQANLGVYVTHRQKVKSEMGVTDRVEAGEKKTGSAATAKPVYVWKAMPVYGPDGKIKRTSNPFSQYGVKVTQVNLQEPDAEPLLEKLLDEKKKLVAKKISSIQKQENAKTEIETAKLEGEAARVKAEQERLIKADAEVIDKKKEVELAKKQAEKEIVERQKLADLAIIDKKKELQVATANEGIQQANERAAKYEAEAIKHKGLAEAEVKKAMYLAVRKDILELEVQKFVTGKLADNLKDFNVEMPTYMSGGNGTGVNNSLDVLMDALSVSELKKLNSKMEAK